MSSAASNASTFIPEDERPQRFSTWRVYGVRLKQWEASALWDRIDEINGTDRSDIASFIAGNSFLRMSVGNRIRDEHGMVSYYGDDVTLRICEDLGIDWKKFPHSTPVIPLDRFVRHAKKKLAGFKLAVNETQWMMQERRIWALFREWVKKDCEHPDCEDHGHRNCEDCYEEMNCWSIAKQIAAVEDEKAKLITSIDAKPRAKAVKVATDALARIAASSRVPQPSANVRKKARPT